jgi:hypothetical protein
LGFNLVTAATGCSDFFVLWVYIVFHFEVSDNRGTATLKDLLTT